jgi:hypothetical protein
MAETLRLASNVTKARLFDASREVKLQVSEMLSYLVEGAEQSDAFKAHRWDGRSSFFDFQTATFPAGFVPIVLAQLKARGHEVILAQKPVPEPLGPALGTVDFSGFGFNTNYDYQPETVRRLLHHRRMIAQVATGGGKSEIATLAIGSIARPTMFLTTRSVLMYQMCERLTAAGFKPGIMGDGVFEPRRRVNVAMVQTIMPRLAEGHPERDRMIKILELMEFVIGEEAHEAGGSSYYDIMGFCTNAHYRLALTATPFMRPDAEANMRLMACFGAIGMQVTEEVLINRGILAKPSFKLISPPVPNTLRRGTKWPVCYDLGIVENPERNRLVVYEAVRAAQHGLPVMILVQRKKHGQILKESLDAAGLNCRYIFGENDQGERARALAALRDGTLQVLIGSTILDVGVDVPAVGVVILAGGGKAEIAHRQRIGRGLRRKKIGPNVCFIVDFTDDRNITLQTHALTRRMILEATPGFREAILRPGEDFDYGQFRAAAEKSHL